LFKEASRILLVGKMFVKQMFDLSFGDQQERDFPFLISSSVRLSVPLCLCGEVLRVRFYHRDTEKKRSHRGRNEKWKMENSPTSDLWLPTSDLWLPTSDLRPL